MDTKNQIIKQLENQKPIYLIYVDDEPDVHDAVIEIAKEYSIEAFCFSNAKEALPAVAKYQADLCLIVSDLKMPEIDGFQFREEVLKITNEVPFFILSAYITTEIALKGVDLKISAFIEKPGGPLKFTEPFGKEVLPRILSIKENRELRASFVEETSDMLADSEEIVLALESNPNDLDAINRFFGCVHTLKGASAFFDPKTLHHFAHKYEDLLKKLQRAEIAFTPQVFEALLRGFDILKMLFEEFKTGEFSGVQLSELLPKLEISTQNSSTQRSNLTAAKNESK